MEKNDQIPIQNIYHMLSYAYQTLHLGEYQHLGTERFHDLQDMYAKILTIGIPVLIRGGLYKDYVSIQGTSNVIKGKLDLNTTLKTNTLQRKNIALVYDEFSEDLLLNQLIKATLLYLCRSPKLSRAKRKGFHGFLPYFSQVSDIELHESLWKKVRYHRQNLRYQFIIDVCRLLYEELLLDEHTTTGSHREFQDTQSLASIFEKFIYAFYKRETNYHVFRPQIPWHTDDGFQEALPMMRTDLVLQRDHKTLIIDAKFYSENMRARFEGGQMKHNAQNLYQLFTYVNNWQKKETETVSGMLLYAKTMAEIQPNHLYQVKGHTYAIHALDLQQDFRGIKEDLLCFAQRHLN